MRNIILGSITILILLIILYFTIGPNPIFYIIATILILIMCGIGAYEYKTSQDLHEISSEIDDIFEKYNIKSGGGPGLNELPTEMIENIMVKLDPPSFISLTSTNKNLFFYRDLISKKMLEKYKVEYENPHDLIYAYNSVFKDAKILILENEINNIPASIEAVYDDTNSDFYKKCDQIYAKIYDYKLKIIKQLDIFEKIKLYNALYNLEKIEITDFLTNNIPVLPNLKELKILRPYKSKLEEFLSKRIKLSNLPMLPKLEMLECYGTDIKEIKDLPNLKYLKCITPLVKIDNLPSLTSVNILSEELQTLSNLPKLIDINMPLYFHNQYIDVINAPKLSFISDDRWSNNMKFDTPRRLFIQKYY